ncbi:MAG: hypothetical protein QME12_02475 [Nanoarchaeota archaeon]|nr:hypothetical protein [Nanoarchaeota archaeon]
MKLGGGITLEGFEELEPAKFVVARKIIGIYARKTSDSFGKLDSFIVAKTGNSIKVSAKCGEKTSEAFSEDSNMFIALSRALSEAAEKAKP